ncbi:MAG: sulfatase [Lentisphaeria bacterium]|nr:sulfatase [Lentisphaeria bacterium]
MKQDSLLPTRCLPHLSRRTFLAGAALAPVTLGLAAPLGGPEKAKRPNILLVTAEDMGCQCEPYGDGTVPTPNLGRLAREGVLFRHAYVTQASCSPSRSSLLTGLYPHQNGQFGLAHLGYRMHRAIPNLPGLLKGLGYRTGIQGKLHVEPASEYSFDVKGNSHSKDIPAYVDSARAFLSARGADPFFLYVNFGDCHKPFVDQVKGLPERPVTPDRVRIFPEHGELDTPELRREVAGYYNSVQRVDAGVGGLLDLLDEFGLAENTLVVFIGDHGPPLSRGKTTTYEFGVRIPMLVRWPGVARPGHDSKALVSTVDILPTLVSAAGGALPSPLAGAPLREVLGGDASRWRDVVVTEYHTHGPGFQPQRAIRDRRYKLILNLRPEVRKDGLGVDGCKVPEALRDPAFAQSEAKRVFDLLEAPPPVEFYDLEKDPIEYHNLAGRPEVAQAQERLRHRLAAWREQTRDPLLDPATFAAYRDHAEDYQKRLPELRLQVKPDRQGRRRVPIDMSPFQKDWKEPGNTLP